MEFTGTECEDAGGPASLPPGPAVAGAASPGWYEGQRNATNRSPFCFHDELTSSETSDWELVRTRRPKRPHCAAVPPASACAESTAPSPVAVHPYGVIPVVRVGVAGEGGRGPGRPDGGARGGAVSEGAAMHPTLSPS
ncbi:hypothetical protein [Streptomyces sp. NPDC001601]|uniref:hypothetical protein n=1 Tax=Streptomyces sp. NPDC001601 TaxID=3364592 RepID=UPI0036AEAE2F